MFLPLLLMPLLILFGLSWILFAFVSPPYWLSSFYFTPRFMYFLGESTGRVLIGCMIGLVGPLLISMFML